MRITPLKPIEKNGLRGFGFSVHFDRDNQESGRIEEVRSGRPFPDAGTFDVVSIEPAARSSDGSAALLSHSPDVLSVDAKADDATRLPASSATPFDPWRKRGFNPNGMGE